MRSLITGCQGFIGKNLAQHLKKQGHHVTGIDKKLKVGDPVFVDEFVGHDMESRITIENDFDRVYHLSADVPNSKGVGGSQLTTGRSNPIQTSNGFRRKEQISLCICSVGNDIQHRTSRTQRSRS